MPETFWYLYRKLETNLILFDLQSSQYCQRRDQNDFEYK